MSAACAHVIQGGANGNLREFANRYECAHAKFGEASAQAAKDLAGQPGSKAKIAQVAGEKIDESFIPRGLPETHWWWRYPSQFK